MICLAIRDVEELGKKNIDKLYYYWGYCLVDKLTLKVKDLLTKIKTECEACSVSANRKPTPLESRPRATHPNHVVTLELKEHGDKYIWYAVDKFSFIANKEAIPSLSP